MSILNSSADVYFALVSKDYFVESEVDPTFSEGNLMVFIELFPFAVRTKSGVIESKLMKWGELVDYLERTLNRNVV